MTKARETADESLLHAFGEVICQHFSGWGLAVIGLELRPRTR